jgi:hypothetical protein
MKSKPCYSGGLPLGKKKALSMPQGQRESLSFWWVVGGLEDD